MPSNRPSPACNKNIKLIALLILINITTVLYKLVQLNVYAFLDAAAHECQLQFNLESPRSAYSKLHDQALGQAALYNI